MFDCVFVLCLFFFKQKTAYEMRISDWSQTCALPILGGALSNHKGVNVPDVVVPMAALTEKDRGDLAFALEQRVDWIALSFVQRPEEIGRASCRERVCQYV